MSGFAPRWLIAPAAIALIAAAMLVCPEPGTAGGEAATDTDPDMAAEFRRLQAQQEAVAARIAYKDELISWLVAGQATLAEVADEFLRMNRETPALNIIRDLYPGSDDQEKSARNVIDFVRSRKLPAERNAEVMGRLRHQFEQTYGHQCASAD